MKKIFFNKKLGMIFFGIAVLVVIALGVYQALTTIRYENYRARISPFYCRLAANKVNVEGPVIFVPGLMGSTLQRSGRTIWLRLSQAFGSSSELVYTSSDTSVRASAVFDRVTLIPGLLEYRSYYTIAAQMACLKQGYVFYYDWRADPEQSAEDFSRLVDRVIKETGRTPSVIAHSLGGLIAHRVVKKQPEKFSKLVYVTVPFQPGIGYIDDIDQGRATGLNKRLLGAEVVFSHPTSFLLLPHRGTTRYKGGDLFSAQTWKRDQLSVFRSAGTDMVQFQEVLDRTNLYHQKLDQPMTLSNTTLLVVGNTRTAFCDIKPNGEREYCPGDGRVAQTAAYPVDTLEHRVVVFTDIEHARQLNDTKLIQTIFTFLSKE